MNTYSEVLFEETAGAGGHLGLITLNRPEVLNSLNHSMINAMYGQLQKWAVADHIKAVIIRAADGRAFCAGGDLRSTYDRFKKHDPSLANFFRDEYQLNRTIFHYPKPYVALLDGITMGGGVGISIHGSHRVATDRLLFAMPETGIGFFPDVGGTYFLPRLPSKIGFYLGLVGARITSDDCVALGIAQHQVPREKLEDIIQGIAEQSFSNDARQSVSEVIAQFATPAKPSPLMEQQDAIRQCFSVNTVENLIKALHECSNPICQESVAAILKKSPTSLKITLRALQEGAKLDFDACMRQEFRLVCRFLQGDDFIEGIRAVIIDKDQTPHWKPNKLEAVSLDEVEKYFAPVTHELV
ncbi:enoyl-CoA hydratase/isomerase family protein [Aquicella lusitana]|uniref:3-hydroxyisobutyryl-CoA hydrolase n=1 Tax=Aquicella lusitana TaxID=254246 RepID=A0A370G561_9COXI|nr:enoyl-CoA hydratase/isomerase family protein [Aquicella lusitana]RDI38948.1 enoyl-CoA hydratase/carnithine racemase [Aquicella lusitana]VVC74303.1 Short-chain-enoyl-CoA hydratase [Aquicella lusitana]